jgi:hypothetical protein
MCYFSDWEPLFDMGDESLAKFFRAAINYAHFGEVPSFSGMDAVIWKMLYPKIDRDGEAYAENCRKKRYARYVGIEKTHNHEPLPYEEWIERIDNRQQASTDVNEHDQLEQQPQKQSQSHPQRELQGDQGGSGGNVRLSPVYEPPSEEEFDQRRAAALSMLENYGAG